METSRLNAARFIDLFAGCGGLSLGLMQAGLQGVFAVELDQMAFRTIKYNFLRPSARSRFSWPTWLPQEAMSIERLLEEHAKDLEMLRGNVDVVVGGPPCQGFSFAGRRDAADPRNGLFEQYVKTVNVVQPRFIVLENVLGMKVPHVGLLRGRSSRPVRSHFQRLCQALDEIDYAVHTEIVDAAQFGVPQRRKRLIALGARRDVARALTGGSMRLLELLEKSRVAQLDELGLVVPVTAGDAISDFEADGRRLVDCEDADSPKGFKEIAYEGPGTDYQRLMNSGHASPMNSMRLARHTDRVRERFAQILKECRRGVRMDDEELDRFSLRKNRVFPMAKDEPAPTITTLPDDILHYSEPRILTVRECARLQSFPDWFEFKGNFTTGGHRRKLECPRYTQVGNAVPPLLAYAIGNAINLAITEVRVHSGTRGIVSGQHVPSRASEMPHLCLSNMR